MNVIKMGKPLICKNKLLENRILVKSSLNARNVGRLLHIIQTLIYVGEFILV